MRSKRVKQNPAQHWLFERVLFYWVFFSSFVFIYFPTKRSFSSAQPPEKKRSPSHSTPPFLFNCFTTLKSGYLLASCMRTPITMLKDGRRCASVTAVSHWSDGFVAVSLAPTSQSHQGNVTRCESSAVGKFIAAKVEISPETRCLIINPGIVRFQLFKHYHRDTNKGRNN